MTSDNRKGPTDGAFSGGDPAKHGGADGSTGRVGPAEDAHGHGLGHVLPLRLLIGVWAALVVLTWVTVAVTWFDLGRLNLWAAMGIATIKAALVALYFMHLRYDRPINGVIFLGTLLFVLLFVGTILMDTQAYLPELIPGYAPSMPR